MKISEISVQWKSLAALGYGPAHLAPVDHDFCTRYPGVARDPDALES